MIYGKELTRQFDRDLLHRVNKAECDRLLERWQSEDCAEAIMKFFSRKNAWKLLQLYVPIFKSYKEAT